jgi:hypothetical protein
VDPDPIFWTKVERVDHQVVIRVGGQVDIATCDRLRAVIQDELYTQGDFPISGGTASRWQVDEERPAPVRGD